MSLDEAHQYPTALEIVAEFVRPARMKAGDHPLGNHGRKYWWQYGSRVEGLHRAIAHLDRCLVSPRVCKYPVFGFCDVDMVFAEQVNVIALSNYLDFCVLQSQVHDTSVRHHASTLGQGIRYGASDCFETFPFPEDWQSRPDLEIVGKTYYEYRAGLMVKNDEGLTKTYNRFHDPDDHDPAIAELRELHAAMDRAVLDAYGWKDIPTDCEFLLDYGIDEEEWGNKKKPYRYRWPEEVHDEVLARLLDLNQKRAEEERLAGLTADRGKAEKKNGSRSGDKKSGPVKGTLL